MKIYNKNIRARDSNLLEPEEKVLNEFSGLTTKNHSFTTGTSFLFRADIDGDLNRRNQ